MDIIYRPIPSKKYLSFPNRYPADLLLKFEKLRNDKEYMANYELINMNINPNDFSRLFKNSKIYKEFKKKYQLSYFNGKNKTISFEKLLREIKDIGQYMQETEQIYKNIRIKNILLEAEIDKIRSLIQNQKRLKTANDYIIYDNIKYGNPLFGFEKPKNINGFTHINCTGNLIKYKSVINKSCSINLIKIQNYYKCDTCEYVCIR